MQHNRLWLLCQQQRFSELFYLVDEIYSHLTRFILIWQDL
jgi:hypothetical protein